MLPPEDSHAAHDAAADAAPVIAIARSRLQTRPELATLAAHFGIALREDDEMPALKLEVALDEQGAPRRVIAAPGGCAAESPSSPACASERALISA